MKVTRTFLLISLLTGVWTQKYLVITLVRWRQLINNVTLAMRQSLHDRPLWPPLVLDQCHNFITIAGAGAQIKSANVIIYVASSASPNENLESSQTCTVYHSIGLHRLSQAMAFGTLCPGITCRDRSSAVAFAGDSSFE